MWRDHFRSAWRGVLNNRLVTAINVCGLALGLAVFFTLFFYVQREFSWDAHWEDAGQIHVLARQEESAAGTSPPIPGAVPYVVGSSLQLREADSIDLLMRSLGSQGTVVVGEQDYANRMLYFAEPAITELLQFETLAGSIDAVFADPRSMALSMEAAETLFGEESALGRTLTFNSQRGDSKEFTVKAVYRLPEPSSFGSWQMLALLDRNALPVQNVDLERWNPASSPRLPALIVAIHLKLKPGIAAAAIEARLREFMDQNDYMTSASGKTRFAVIPLQDVHLMPTLFNNGNTPERLWLYAAIGVLVLLISGCNFVMLTTLRSIDRMREIGIRKTLGGEAASLMRQYLVDVFCQAVLAALLAVTLLELLLPWLQARLDFELELDLLGWKQFVQCLAVVGGFTLLSGLYPAFLMTRGRPAVLLRSGTTAANGGSHLRKLLVGTQFGIVIVLLLASAVAWQQIEYTRTRDRGYELEHVMGIRLVNAGLIARTAAVVTEFRRVAGVAGAAVGNIAPGTIMIGTPNRVSVTKPDGSLVEADLQPASVGAGYFDVMSVSILAGREFVSDRDEPAPFDPPPPQVDVVLNLSASVALGFGSPAAAVGAVLGGEARLPDGQTRKQDMHVIGVVADTQFSSAMLPPVAQVYRLQPELGFVAVRFEPDADRAAAMAELESAWTGIMDGAPFLTLTPDVLEGPQLEREQFEVRVVIGSALLALVIALLGLYGLVSATVLKRVKEIGVRKTMGARSRAIVVLLLWQFSKPIVIANLVAWPLGLWIISQWLQRFPYRLETDLILWSALAASLVALVVAWCTVGLMAAKAASAKPVLALRYE